MRHLASFVFSAFLLTANAAPALARVSQAPADTARGPSAAQVPPDTALETLFYSDEPPSRPHVFRPWSITVSPLWATLFMANGTVEYQPSRRFGLAAKAHYGVPDLGEDDGDDTDFDLFGGKERIFGVGGEARLYPHRNGFHLAAGTSWWRVRSMREDFYDEVSTGWMANGLLGWKGVFRSGFTADLQAGASLQLTQDGDWFGDSWFPLVRVNVGWSL